MTTRERVQLLASAYPRLLPRAQLLHLLRSQLGHVEALDRWVSRDGARMRARAPRSIYHVCAGNLAISACTSLVHGLLLGAENGVKLPSAREDSPAQREILAFIAGLPKPLRSLVKASSTFDPELFREAEVIVAFGSDATMEQLRSEARWTQRFIAHGHAVSLLWLEEKAHFTPQRARACAVDILTYDQLGCLSPQALYAAPGGEMNLLADRLASALEAEWRRIPVKPLRTISSAAKIREARDLAFARGHSIRVPSSGHLGWTVICDPNPDFQPSPLHGTIYLRQAGPSRLRQALAPVAGRISTVGRVGKTSSRWEKLFLSLGVSRFCPAGRMQFPPLSWHHGGRASLADLVRWIDAE